MKALHTTYQFLGTVYLPPHHSRCYKRPVCCVIGCQELSRDLHRRFVKLTALVKGYLTRRLLKTEKVQSIIKSISVRRQTYFLCHICV